MKQPPRNPTLLPGGPTKESEARPPELGDLDSEMGWVFVFFFFFLKWVLISHGALGESTLRRIWSLPELRLTES